MELPSHPCGRVDREVISAPFHSHLVSLIHAEGMPPGAFAVLVPSQGHTSFYDLLEHRPLPRPARWAFERYGMKSGVRVDTMQRFKGLEASVVYLWGADGLDRAEDKEILYVTLRRAKARLFLVGDAKRCSELIRTASNGSGTATGDR